MNAYKTRSPGKPIRMGWNIYRLCDQGEITHGFCLDDLVSVGAYTYDQVHEYGKRYTLMHKFLHELADGTTCVGDSVFYCPKAMHAAKRVWPRRNDWCLQCRVTCSIRRTYSVHYEASPMLVVFHGK